jgi:AcrR family transcriptional regulator
MFVEYGPDVPLDEIARRAGLSSATVYRHFSDRAELVLSVVLFVMKRTADKAKRAVREDTDSFEALRCFVHAAADERIWACARGPSTASSTVICSCSRTVCRPRRARCFPGAPPPWRASDAPADLTTTDADRRSRRRPI